MRKKATLAGKTGPPAKDGAGKGTEGMSEEMRKIKIREQNLKLFGQNAKANAKKKKGTQLPKPVKLTSKSLPAKSPGKPKAAGSPVKGQAAGSPRKDKGKQVAPSSPGASKKRKAPSSGRQEQQGGGPRKFRYRPGTVALREIRKYQKATGPVVPRAPFGRLVREISNSYTGEEFR